MFFLCFNKYNIIFSIKPSPLGFGLENYLIELGPECPRMVHYTTDLRYAFKYLCH